MYDEIYKSWLKIKSKHDDSEVNKVRIKILEYLNQLQNTLNSKSGILRKICELKIANLKLIIDSLEEYSNNKIVTAAATSIEKEEAEIKPQGVEREGIEKERSEPKYLIIRLLQSIPAIVGSDLENYGPFNAEDIVTLPVKNAHALIKRNAAVEINWGGRNENG